MTPNLVQFAFRELAKRTGFLHDINDRNVMSPHSFRESFSSILLNNGVPDSIVDFLLGHEIGTMAQAYKKTDYEKVKEMYAQIEPKLSLGNSNGNHTKIEALEETITQIQKENMAHQTALDVMTNKTIEFEEENKELKNKYNEVESNIKGLERLTRSLLYYHARQFNPPEKWQDLRKFIEERCLEDLTTMINAIEGLKA
jgi:predicted nuclease with TOPRIM domain